MDESKRRAIAFIEKEVKTYVALARFFSKMGIQAELRVGQKKILLSPSFYKERMQEARKLASDLRKHN